MDKTYNFFKEKMKNDLEKAMKIFEKTSDYWKKITGSYVYPNGLLGNIPVYITNFSFSKANSVTQNILFFGEEFSDNLEKENYTIDLELICFGPKYLESIRELHRLSEEKDGTDNIISLFYKKNKINYFPLVITNISYSDNAESTRLQTVSISLKQISLSVFYDETCEITNTLTQNNTYTICESMDMELPQNLYEEMKLKHPEFRDITNEIENFFDFSTK